jgi:outer membrane protein TolC
LLVARENVLAQRGVYYPSVSGSFSATRAKTSNELSPVPNASVFEYSLFTPEVSVSFVPDVFGLKRRTVESLKAQQEQARFALAATNITLSSNVAAAAIQEASLRAQIDATNAKSATTAGFIVHLSYTAQANIRRFFDLVAISQRWPLAFIKG